ncbi:MAG TPA: AIR carboxylase family protein, partial [Candidatus Acidoferrum sp.]|nr:AIR carboxylase family protein [Candidatus Acidoferrum sp.]
MAPKSTAAAPLVGILMGSDSDLPTMQEAVKILQDFGVPLEVRICSAHRTPDRLARYARQVEARGLRV